MTGDVQILRLCGLVLPEDSHLERDLIGSSEHHDEQFLARYDRKTLFYDCFVGPCAQKIYLLGPPLLNFRPMVEEAEFSLDGKIIPIDEIRDLSRCSVVVLNCPAGRELSIRHDLFGGRLAVNPSFADGFSGLNGLYSISLNNRLEWIEDWLSYYVRVHGLQTLVLADNGSTDYSMKDLRATIASVAGLHKAVILDARFPFGPTAENKTAYAALFLQRSLAELGRLRFFARSRAVMNADIDELVYSKSGQSIFDATVASNAGYLRANAKWVYADVQPGQNFARHFDHRYVSVSGKPKANRKWCVVPNGPQAGRQWRTHFINSRKDPVDPDFTLWHFRNVSTSWKNDRFCQNIEQTEDHELTNAMKASFPKSCPGTTRPKQPTKGHIVASERTVERGIPKFLISTCMKDEGPFILEWLAWHKSIGIDNYIVFTNDCSDGTDLLLDRLDTLGHLRHLPNPALACGSTYFQPSALLYTPLLSEWRKADYFISMDVDEFINIRVGNGCITDLISATGPFDALSMSELNHGSNGKIEFEPGLVTEQFPRHQTETPGRHKSLRGVKTISRISDKLQQSRNHRPDFLEDADDVVWLDGSGRKLETLLKDPTLNGIDVRGTYDLVALDHFPLRSLESYLIKMFRGDVVVKDKSVSQRYWRLRNKNEGLTSIFERQRAEFIAQLGALLEDKELKELHEKSCKVHADRAVELLKQPHFIERKDWILQNAWD